jgi:hypothetical protein
MKKTKIEEKFQSDLEDIELYSSYKFVPYRDVKKAT